MNTISYDSIVPFNYRTAVYRFYVKRAFQVCSDVYLSGESIKIKEIACEKGFSNKFINKLIYEYDNSNKISTNVSKDNERPTKFCSKEYIPHLFEWIKYALKKYNVILIAKPPTKLEYLVHRRIDPIDKYDKSEIYIIPFKINSSSKTYTYVGMTTRKLLERIKEHMTDINK